MVIYSLYIAVILFGSLVKGEATPASDADSLILLKESSKRFIDRIPDFLFGEPGLSVDVFPYTLDEFWSLLKENRGIAKEILNKKILLYRREDVEIGDLAL